jgi:hypothetical protein
VAQPRPDFGVAVLVGPVDGHGFADRVDDDEPALAVVVIDHSTEAKGPSALPVGLEAQAGHHHRGAATS